MFKNGEILNNVHIIRNIFAQLLCKRKRTHRQQWGDCLGEGGVRDKMVREKYSKGYIFKKRNIFTKIKNSNFKLFINHSSWIKIF